MRTVDQLFIRNTNIRISAVLDLMAEGLSRDEILTEHPELSPADLAVVLAHRFSFAKRVLN